LDDNVVIAAFNREKVSVDVSLANVPNAEYFDYNNEKSTIKANKEGVLQIKLPSIGFRILIRRS
jgi:LEA14-like dessication related protein